MIEALFICNSNCNFPFQNAECYFSAEDDIVGREDETVGEETLPVSQVTNVRRYRTPPRAYLLPPKVMTFPRQLHLHHPHAAAYTSPGSMNEGYLRRRRNALTVSMLCRNIRAELTVYIKIAKVSSLSSLLYLNIRMITQ